MIRKATLNDLDALTVLFDQYLVFYKKPTDIKTHKNYLKERLENNEAIVFMAFDEQNKAIEAGLRAFNNDLQRSHRPSRGFSR